MQRVFKLQARRSRRVSNHEPDPGPGYMTESAAEALGRRFLGEVTPDFIGWDLAVEVSYFDVEGRPQTAFVEQPSSGGVPHLLGDMHHAAVAIIEEGGRATVVEIAARLRWFEPSKKGGYCTGRVHWRRAETACMAGVEHGIIGVDGDLYTARVEDSPVSELGE